MSARRIRSRLERQQMKGHRSNSLRGVEQGEGNKHPRGVVPVKGWGYVARGTRA